MAFYLCLRRSTLACHRWYMAPWSAGGRMEEQSSACGWKEWISWCEHGCICTEVTKLVCICMMTFWNVFIRWKGFQQLAVYDVLKHCSQMRPARLSVIGHRTIVPNEDWRMFSLLCFGWYLEYRVLFSEFVGRPTISCSLRLLKYLSR